MMSAPYEAIITMVSAGRLTSIPMVDLAEFVFTVCKSIFHIGSLSRRTYSVISASWNCQRLAVFRNIHRHRNRHWRARTHTHESSLKDMERRNQISINIAANFARSQQQQQSNCQRQHREIVISLEIIRMIFR